MSSEELRVSNRAIYFRKSITQPDFTSESVLVKDSFQFLSLWLERNCKEALPYWRQAENYYHASKNLPPLSAPLTSYYCFLNAVKTLLIVKGIKYKERHGVSGKFEPDAKRALSNENVNLKEVGILAELTKYLAEPEKEKSHTLYDLLGNLPFVHRAYRHTYSSQKELFIPVSNVLYKKNPDNNKVWCSSVVKGRFNDLRAPLKIGILL